MKPGTCVAGKWFVLALVLLAWTSLAQASGARAAHRALEASMLVTGMIEVDPEGRVQRFEFDQRDRLPPEVDRLLVGALPAWRFAPTLIDGVPAAIRTSMWVRVAVTRAPDQADAYVLRIAGASFGGSGGLTASPGNDPPEYPREFARRGVQGTVYVLLRIGRAGTVDELAIEQVNLQLIAPEVVLRQARDALATATSRAARHWTFATPADADQAQTPFWVARVPVDFVMRDRPQPGYGEWTTYVPGPRQPAPWARHDTAVGADSFAANQVYLLGSGPKLLTPLGG